MTVNMTERSGHLPQILFCSFCKFPANPIHLRMNSVEKDFENGLWPFGGQGDATNVPNPSGTSCGKINDILTFADEMTSKCSFGGVATTLPFVPGLFVDGVGQISAPLVPEQADKLIAKCNKFLSEPNIGSMNDKAVHKIWQLAPDQLKIENLQWVSGLEKLVKLIAQGLGYENVSLEYVLCKLLVYGKGSHVEKHQVSQNKDGTIAILVVQPPSSHEGGNLVVYREGKPRYHHDFGKVDGTAAYMTHYAVHYPDAESEVKEVTKGYGLALVYSLSLPTMMHDLQRDPSIPTSDDLADALSEMEHEDESFALLLSDEYTRTGIENVGARVLESVDGARCRALEEANSVVLPRKKLQFFIAKLSHKIFSSPVDSFGGDWQEESRHETIHWYDTSGVYLGKSSGVDLKEKLNFLNPDQETFAQLWEPRGRCKEEPATNDKGLTRITKHFNFAIIAWPAIKHLENALRMMPVEIAVEALSAQKPVDPAALREFLNGMSKRLGSGTECSENDAKVSVQFCQGFCKLLVDAGDPELVKFFFSKYCPPLGNLEGNSTLIPIITTMVQAFDWNIIGDALLNVLGNETSEDDEEKNDKDTAIEMTLQVVDGLDDGIAQQSLLSMAVEMVLKMDEASEHEDDDEGELMSPKMATIFWKHVIQTSDKKTFDRVTQHFKNKDPSEIGQAIEVFSHFVSDLDKKGYTFKELSSITARRMSWLQDEIQILDTPFSWEMPDAEFPNKKIQHFLRGPEVTMKTIGVMTFSGLPTARKYAAKCVRENQDEASFTMKAAGKGKKAYVTIKKTRKRFDTCQNELRELKVELEDLTKHYQNDERGTPQKKSRLK